MLKLKLAPKSEGLPQASLLTRLIATTSDAMVLVVVVIDIVVAVAVAIARYGCAVLDVVRC